MSWKDVRRAIDHDWLAVGVAPVDWGFGVMIEDMSLHIALGPFFVWLRAS